MTEAAAWRVVLRGILLVFGLLLAVFAARELQSVIVQLLLAVLLAAAATPLVNALTVSGRAQGWRRRLARGFAALIVFFGALVVLVLGSRVVVATVAPDLGELSTSLPEYGMRVQRAIEDLLADNPYLAAQARSVLPSLATVLGDAAGLLGQVSRLLRVATAVLSGVLYLIFTLVLALYLTIDGDRIRRYLVQFLPMDRQTQAGLVSERIGLRLGAWARGEALLAAIIGGLTWLGAITLGLPYAGALALIAAVGELVPNLGPIIAAIPLIAVGFLSSPLQGLLAIVLAIFIQQLENNLIVPRVMAQAVNLHPVAVMLAILAGNQLLGVPGALLAVPVVASLSVILDEVQRERLARRPHGWPREDSHPGADATSSDAATGRFFLLTGPSGAGKTALLRALTESGFPITRLITWTSRPPRADEVNGVDYVFASPEEFMEQLRAGALLEHAVVYGHYKGLPCRTVQEGLRRGQDAIVSLDVQGAATVRQLLPAAVVIAVRAPLESLASRQALRAGDPPDDQRLRLAAASAELANLSAADYVICNRDGRLAKAVEDLQAIIRAERARVRPRLVTVRCAGLADSPG